MEFSDKFIAFVDILGFSGFVADAEGGTGKSLDELLELLALFGSPAEREPLATHGPTICSASRYCRPDLDFRLTQISDCVIISTEISPAGVIALIDYVWQTIMRFLVSGHLCRGCLTRGNIYHTDHQVIGTGYQRAYSHERCVAFRGAPEERGTPFVEVDQPVTAYIEGCGDQCVQRLFWRAAARDGDFVALFPFKRLEHSFVIEGTGRPFDIEQQRRENWELRKLLGGLIERVRTYADHNNLGAIKKVRHYLAVLDAQRDLCDRTDEFLDRFNTPCGT